MVRTQAVVKEKVTPKVANLGDEAGIEVMLEGNKNKLVKTKDNKYYAILGKEVHEVDKKGLSTFLHYAPLLYTPEAVDYAIELIVNNGTYFDKKLWEMAKKDWEKVEKYILIITKDRKFDVIADKDKIPDGAIVLRAFDKSYILRKKVKETNGRICVQTKRLHYLPEEMLDAEREWVCDAVIGFIMNFILDNIDEVVVEPTVFVFSPRGGLHSLYKKYKDRASKYAVYKAYELDLIRLSHVFNSWRIVATNDAFAVIIRYILYRKKK